MTSNRNSRRHGRGFAIVAAVVLVGLAGLAFVALTSLVRHDLRRTARATAEAQLRQLLLAGESVARATLDAPAGGAETIPLPATLAPDGGKLTVTRAAAAGDTRAARIDAEFAGLRSSQTVTYARRDGRWVLERAAVSPTGGAVTPGR